MTTNLSQEFRTISYLSHLVLQSDKEKLQEAMSQENWDIKNVNICLFLDDVEVRNEKIEPILKDWARRSYEQKIEQDEKKLQETERWVKAMQDKEALDYEIDKRVKLKLEKMIDSLDV